MMLIDGRKFAFTGALRMRADAIWEETASVCAPHWPPTLTSAPSRVSPLNGDPRSCAVITSFLSLSLLSLYRPFVVVSRL